MKINLADGFFVSCGGKNWTHIQFVLCDESILPNCLQSYGRLEILKSSKTLINISVIFQARYTSFSLKSKQTFKPH
jgi:hypothetical protein